MSSLNADADGFRRPPASYDANYRFDYLNPEKYPGLKWRMRADGTVVWEYRTGKGSPAQNQGRLDARSEAEAITQWKIKSGKAESGELVLNDGSKRMDDAWKLYVSRLDAWIARGRMSRKTRAVYASSYSNHIGPVFGQAYLSGIDKDSLVDFFADLEADGLASWTCHGIKTVLKHCFDTAVAERWLTISPLSLVSNIDLPKQEPREQYLPRLFRNEELVRMFEACPPLYVRMLIVLGFTGLRVRELCGLRWKFVNFEERVLYIREQLLDASKKDGIVWSTEGPKGDRTAKVHLSKRDIGMFDAVYDALVAQRNAERVKGYGGDEDFVFTTSAGTGTPVSADNFRSRGVQKAAEKAGLGHVRPHDFRHTLASLLAAAGIHDTVAAQMMGHTVAIYHERYAKAFKDAVERRNAHELLEGQGFGQRLDLRLVNLEEEAA